MTVYKLHLGMSVNDVLNVYPDSDIDLFRTGKDIGGKADKFHSKDKEEIKQLKFGLHGARRSIAERFTTRKTIAISICHLPITAS